VRRSALLVLLALLALALGGLLWKPAAERAASAVRPARVERSASPQNRPVTMQAKREPAPVTLGTELGIDPGGAEPAFVDPALADYRRASIYPPSSRPLRPTDRHLVDWNRRWERPRAAGCDPRAKLLFSADRYWLVGADRLTSFVELEGADLPWRVVAATAEAVDSISGVASGALALDYQPAGARWVNRLSLADLGLQRAARVRLTVEVECGAPATTESRVIHVVYTPEPAVPARFTGSFSDRIDNGSLVVRAGIEVVRGGRFVIDCNLYDAKDRPVAWTRFKAELEPGSHDLALTFFGKILIDVQAEAPLRLGELRGARHVEHSDPDLEPMPAYEGSHIIDGLDLSELSDAEWDSPEKRAKLAMLELLAADPAGPRIRKAQP
jgi:hypothetical protein